MRPLLLITFSSFAFLAGCASNQPAIAPATSTQAAPQQTNEESKFKLCESESFMALHMARNYMLISKRDKSAVLNYISRDDKYANAVAEEIFSGVDSGKIRHYADYAADRLLKCSQEQGMPITKSQDLLRMCFARVDIPFLLSAFKDQGLAKSEAINRATTALKDERQYPKPLITAVASQMYAPGQQASADRHMKQLFWSCTFSQEWSQGKAE
jgi:hypothetical protein